MAEYVFRRHRVGLHGQDTTLGFRILILNLSGGLSPVRPRDRFSHKCSLTGGQSPCVTLNRLNHRVGECIISPTLKYYSYLTSAYDSAATRGSFHFTTTFLVWPSLVLMIFTPFCGLLMRWPSSVKRSISEAPSRSVDLIAVSSSVNVTIDPN